MSDRMDRYQEITTFIRQRGDVRVRELKDRFYLSEATVRRLLSDLQDRGVVRRYYGGAALVEPQALTSARRREITNEAEKRAIGRQAAAIVREGMTLLLMGGTTVEAMCPYLFGAHLTVITNSLPVVNALVWAPHVDLIVLGGYVNASELEMRGALTERGMSTLRADRMYLGTTGIHPVHGLMTEDSNAVGAYHACVRVSDELYVLADHSKLIRPKGATRIAGLDELHCVITDSGAPPSSIEELSRANIQVLVADPVAQDDAGHGANNA